MSQTSSKSATKGIRYQETRRILSSVSNFKEHFNISTCSSNRIETFSFNESGMEISFKISTLFTNDNSIKRRLKVTHLWLNKHLRKKGYGTTIKTVLEQIVANKPHITEITFCIQVSDGDEDEIFDHWGYEVTGPYESEYENKVIEATKEYPKEQYSLQNFTSR